MLNHNAKSYQRKEQKLKNLKFENRFYEFLGQKLVLGALTFSDKN